MTCSHRAGVASLFGPPATAEGMLNTPGEPFHTNVFVRDYDGGDPQQLTTYVIDATGPG